VSIFSADEIRQWRSEYHPCHLGLHVFDPYAGTYGGVTVQNFPMDSAGLARKVFDECRSQCESAGGEPDDYLVDLFEGENSCVNNFFISRQMLSRLATVVSAESRRPRPSTE